MRKSELVWVHVLEVASAQLQGPIYQVRATSIAPLVLAIVPSFHGRVHLPNDHKKATRQQWLAFLLIFQLFHFSLGSLTLVPVIPSKTIMHEDICVVVIVARPQMLNTEVV